MKAKEIKRFSRFSEKDTVGVVFSSYVNHLERRGLSPRTVETYADCLLTLERWMAEAGKEDPTKLTAADIEEFQVWLSRAYKSGGGRFSASHQGKHVAVVRGLFEFLKTENKILGNPASSLRYPKIKKTLPRDVLTIAELKKLLSLRHEAAEGLRDAAVLRIFALSGLRASELAALNVKDFNLAEREITVRGGKGAKDRLTFCDEATAELVARYLSQAWHRLVSVDTEALILSDSGHRANCGELREIVKAAAKRAGLEKRITPHALRHTFCTLLLQHGCNLKVIAEIVGHARLETTAKYTRVGIKELSEVYRRAHPRSAS